MRTPLLVVALALGLALVGCDQSLQEFGPVPADQPSLVNGAGTPESLDLEALPAGTIVSTVFGDGGSGPITVQGVSPLLGGNVALIFDSSNPTGGDTDLGSPNQACGGPGIGGNVGPGTPYENRTALEHILIIAANLVDGNGDGLVDNPDDIDQTAIDGAYITIGFEALGTVTARGIRVIDIDGNGPNPRVELFGEDGSLLAVFPLPNDMPNNGVASIDFGDVPGVARMVVHLNGSGGLDTVIFLPEEEGGAPCRVTGGGVDTYGDWDGTFAKGNSGHGGDVDRYEFGGQAGAPTANQPQPYGEWTHHQQHGPDGSFVFHAGTSSAPPGTEIDLIECSDPGWCHPARPAPAKQIDFEGVGTFKNIRNPSPPLEGVVPGETFHWFEVHIEDLGEPGRSGRQDPPGDECSPVGHEGTEAPCSCPDFYRITIYEGVLDPATPNKTDIIYEVYGYLTGGNLQIHPPIQ